MKAKIRFYDQDRWFAEFQEPYAYFGVFLLCDVQGTFTCDHLVNSALSVLSGETPNKEWSTNGSFIDITPDYVLIVDAYSRATPPVFVSLDAFLAALRYWRSALL